MSDYLPSSPYFFRRIKVSTALLLLLLLGASLFVTAPLQPPADIGRVPNPSKSAWFLLWTQELISYSGSLVYLIFGVGLLFVLLPWLPISPPAKSARWFAKEQRWVSLITLLTFLAIVGLTVVAAFFRGANWDLLFG